MNDSRWLDDLDSAWDAIAQRTPSGGTLDAESQQVLDRLHRLQASADASTAGRRRTWSPPKRTHRSFLSRSPRFSVVHAYAVVGLLLLVTMAGAYSISTEQRQAFSGSTPLPAAGGQKLYRIDARDGSWQRIDPQTLAAIPGDAGPAFPGAPAVDNSQRESFVEVSKDGSTLLSFYSTPNPSGPSDTVYKIYDAATRRLRTEINPDGTYSLNSSSLSADGSRIVFFERRAPPRAMRSATSSPQ